jgi:D-alanine-D-alanine ligase
MDKIVTNMVLDASGIPRAPWFGMEWSGVLPDAMTLERQVQEIGGYPVFVKPANTGSSVGVSKVKLPSELSAALELAARFDRRIVVEKGIKGRELEIGVLGGSTLIASPAVAEVLPKREFYDYEAKYLEDSTKIELPAKISAELVARIQELALRAFRAVDANGMARIDFFYDEAADKIYLNELNTIPGFTAISQYPALMKTAGFSYPELISELVDIALERQRQTEALVI